MVWSMEFRYDAQHDVVIAEFRDCLLATPKDVERWEREVGARLATFGRPVDLLIGLDGLVVRAAASAAFGLSRRRVLELHTLSSYRYGGDRSTTTAVFTSAVIHGAAANVFVTREEALAALLSDRKRAF